MTPFFKTERPRHPASSAPLSPVGQTVIAAGVDFDVVLREARRIRRCAECGNDLDFDSVPRAAFCSDRCRYRFRDRRNYVEDPEREREKSRRYYERNRDAVLARRRVRAAELGPRVRPPLVREPRFCSECGDPLEGRQLVVCSRRCKDRRYARLHPEEYRAKERRKAEQRKARRRENLVTGRESGRGAEDLGSRNQSSAQSSSPGHASGSTSRRQ
jgi:endogenous inhibitor of DNA gyrase (YacG/DUF329 family)